MGRGEGRYEREIADSVAWLRIAGRKAKASAMVTATAGPTIAAARARAGGER